MNQITKNLQRIFNNPSLMVLLFFILFFGLVLYFAGDWLMPVIISVVLAYLLEGVIQRLEKIGLSRIFSIILIFLVCTIAFVSAILWLVPILIAQFKELLTNVPSYFSLVQERLLLLSQKYPDYMSTTDIKSILGNINNSISNYSRDLLSYKFISSIISIISIIVYAVLVPILIFFFLKDKKIILNWIESILPSNNQILKDIWTEVDMQIGNYIRGKFIEILIVWAMCFVLFSMFGLQYSLLLGLLVGFSVLIPYIGATIVTIPVIVIAYMQFNFDPTFWWVVVLYFVTQIIDGNVIVPLIFSEAVNIHPTALIIAVLVFGGLWGFWGLFFAIPLATVVKAIIEAWRKYKQLSI